MPKSATAPGAFRRDARPPISPDPAPTPGAVAPSLRRTVVPRPPIRPIMARRRRRDDEFRPTPADVAVTDGYVRRFWTAALGPGAVADLLRLAAAAEGGRSLPRPVHLDALVRVGLVGGGAGAVVIVSDRVPLLPRHLLTALPPGLRRSHDEWVASMV